MRVSVDAGLMKMLMNALQRDADEGKVSQLEMLQEIERDMVAISEEQNIEDGWVTWNGGERPFPCEVIVRIRFRDGDEINYTNCKGLRWNHIGMSGDIVAYKLLK